MHCRFEGGATKVLRACAGTDLTAAARHGSPSSSSSHASLLRVSGGRLEAAARNLVSCAAISFEALPASSRCSVKAAMRGGRPPPRSAPQAAETSPCIRRCVNVKDRERLTETSLITLTKRVNSAAHRGQYAVVLPRSQRLPEQTTTDKTHAKRAYTPGTAPLAQRAHTHTQASVPSHLAPQVPPDSHQCAVALFPSTLTPNPTGWRCSKHVWKNSMNLQ